MVCLEYVEVSGSRAQQQGNSAFLGSDPSWTCTLRRWEPEWAAPVNLSCVAGVLTAT